MHIPLIYRLLKRIGRKTEYYFLLIERGSKWPKGEHSENALCVPAKQASMENGKESSQNRMKITTYIEGQYQIESISLIKLAFFLFYEYLSIKKYVLTKYMKSPEVLLGSARNSTPVDIWSIGTVFAELKNTLPKWKPGSLAYHVKNLDENCLDLLSKMLVYDLAKQISGKMALSHPYFNVLDNQMKKM
ncbi:unnamed protein product [Nyctereutes procyonoides]|uniref:(raccoon dog) hypothetical protein n=1 Tax=Nyctereutes procyonoides TaxID=34880 RepID=A0A811ZBK4_NYCPR|nr:unnamed protein product [Nyctereutes procyonoides]